MAVVALAESFERLAALFEVREGGGRVHVKVCVEVSNSVSGCRICQEPIPKGHRFHLAILTSEQRDYYAHLGCITKATRSIVPSAGGECWDCGAEPPEGATVHPHAAFTTTRMIWSHICTKCTSKGRWGFCVGCEVWYPHHLLSEVADAGEGDGQDLPRGNDLDEFTSNFLEERIAPGTHLCEWCSNRLRIATVDWVEEHREEIEAERRTHERHYRQIQEELEELRGGTRDP